MRDLYRVIGFLIQEVIPPEQVALRERLNALARSVMYMAPELQAEAWRTLEVLLETELGPPDCEWKKRVANIVNGNEKIPTPLIERLNEAYRFIDADPVLRTNELLVTAMQDAIDLINNQMPVSVILNVSKYYYDILTKNGFKAERTLVALERAAWCCSKVPELVAEKRVDKAMRWMCFAQGVLMAKGVFTPDDLMVHSRGEVDLATLPAPIIRVDNG